MGTSTNGILFFGITASEPESAEEIADYLELDLLIEEDSDDAMEEVIGSVTDFPLDYHCANEHPIPFIYAEKFVALRGYTEEIDSLPEIPTATVKELAQAADKLGWDGPSWYLVSWWG